jgi:hypothetical protein
MDEDKAKAEKMAAAKKKVPTHLPYPPSHSYSTIRASRMLTIYRDD